MGRSSSVVERYTVSHAAGYFLTDEVVVVVVGALVVEVAGFWVAVVVGAAVEVVAEEAAVPRVVVVVAEEVAAAEDDGTDDEAMSVDVVAEADSWESEADSWESEADADDVTDADTEADKVVRVGWVVHAVVVLSAAVVAALSAAVEVAAGAGVTAAGAAGWPPCGQKRHAAHTAEHSTNRAAVADSHRIGRRLGVGMTRFWLSGVIHRGQKRASARRLAPQCGQVFIRVYPNVSKLFSNKISLISMTDSPLQMP